MKKLVILGSTGSIGTQTLEVVDYLADSWQVLALTANNNAALLETQARKYRPKYVVIMNEKLAEDLKYKLQDLRIEILTGMSGLTAAASLPEADLVVNSLVGAAGLRPSISALQADKQLALANKESLVIGGEIIKGILAEKKKKILPIDSEHNAIFQLLRGHGKKEVKQLLLTASGGPFINLPAERFKDVTVEEALNHPNWEMGSKITIDSATMMNKGLEVIEAHWLFDQPYDKIKVVVHPESIIHSMVEFIDRTITAELGVADMRMAIQNVMTYPERVVGLGNSLDLFRVGQLNFLEADFNKFPALKLAYQVGKEGGTMPVVLNAANEIAVAAFLHKKISFTDIPATIERVLAKHDKISRLTLDDILQVDQWARRKAEEELRC